MRLFWNTRLFASLLVAVLLVTVSFAAKPGDGSLLERGTTALQEGRVELAAEMLGRFTEAMPENDRGWYNLACALALSGQEDRALTALDYAQQAGYNDSTWASRDTDLETLRDREEFERILARMGEQQRLQRAIGELGDWMPMNTLGHYALHLPEGYDPEGDRRYPLLVILHGAGGNEAWSDMLRENLALEDVIVAMPRAPQPHRTVAGGFRYWPHVSEGITDAEEVQGYEMACDWHEQVVEKAIERVRVDDGRIAFLGFSQGGASTIMAFLREPDMVRYGVVIAGYLPEAFGHRDGMAAQAERQGELLILHGREDQGLSHEDMGGIADEFRQAGVTATMNLYDAGHTVTGEMVEDAAAWLRTKLELE